MYVSEVRVAIIKIYKATPDTMWPREAYELALAAYGLDRDKHVAVMTEAGAYVEDRQWWLNQLEDLNDMIVGNYERFPWLKRE